MHKDELLELYKQMVIIKDHFPARDRVNSSLFDPYGELAVEPSHVHKSKNEYKHVVFVSDNALMIVVNGDELSGTSRIDKRMEELADDAKGKI